MARRVDLIDQFTELVVGADDPRRLAERTLEVVMSLLNARAGAVFTCAGDEVTLFASRGIDQAVLDIVPVAWAAQREALRRGEAFYVPDRGSERRLPAEVAERPGPASFVMSPCTTRMRSAFMGDGPSAFPSSAQARSRNADRRQPA